MQVEQFTYALGVAMRDDNHLSTSTGDWVGNVSGTESAAEAGVESRAVADAAPRKPRRECWSMIAPRFQRRPALMEGPAKTREKNVRR